MTQPSPKEFGLAGAKAARPDWATARVHLAESAEQAQEPGRARVPVPERYEGGRRPKESVEVERK